MGDSALRKRHTVILTLAVSLLLSAGSAYSQETTGKVGIASATYREDRGDSALFKPMIANIVSFELEEAGFYTESFEGEPERDEMFRQAAEGNMDLLLMNRYTVEGEQVFLTSSCYYVPERRLLVEVSGSGDINLALDGVIQTILQDIIDQLEEMVDDFPSLARTEQGPEPETTGPAQEESAETAESEQPEVTEPGPAAEDELQDEPEEGLGAGEDQQTTVIAETVQAGPEESEKKFRRFELSLGFSPYFPVGAASRYFTLGLEPWLYTGIRFRAGSSSITLGAYGGVNLFTAQGLLISSENMLISSGLDLRLLTREEDVLRVGFRLAGGAAFLLVNPNEMGYQNAVVPFGSGGLSVDIGLGAFAFAFQFNFTAYFEQSVIIMGFSPGGQVSLRL